MTKGIAVTQHQRVVLVFYEGATRPAKGLVIKGQNMKSRRFDPRDALYSPKKN